jgi:ribonuclease HI
MSDSIEVYTDGSAHNLGDGEYAKAASAIHSIDLGITKGYYLGDGVSSNMAEYEAIIAAMKIAINKDVKNLTIVSDSELCVRQILKNCLGRPGYACSDHKLIPRLAIVKELIGYFAFFDIVHKKREFNSEADKAAEIAVKGRNIVPLPSTWSQDDVSTKIEKE